VVVVGALVVVVEALVVVVVRVVVVVVVAAVVERSLGFVTAYLSLAKFLKSILFTSLGSFEPSNLFSAAEVFEPCNPSCFVSTSLSSGSSSAGGDSLLSRMLGRKFVGESKRIRRAVPCLAGLGGCLEPLGGSASAGFDGACCFCRGLGILSGSRPGAYRDWRTWPWMEADSSSSGRRRASAAGLKDGSGAGVMVVVVYTGSVVVVWTVVVPSVGASVLFLTMGMGRRDRGRLKPSALKEPKFLRAGAPAHNVLCSE